MKITVLGGACGDNSSGSCILVQILGLNILIDYGLCYLPDGKTVEFPTIPPGIKVHLVIFTHAHVDHAGGLPVVARMFPDAPVFMTRPTANMVFSMLQKNLYNKVQKDKEGKEIPKHYNAWDLKTAHKNLKIIGSPEEKIYVGNPDEKSKISVAFPKKPAGEVALEISFLPSGHIRGAISVLFKTPEKTVMFSGDMCLNDQATVLAAKLPSTKIDAIFIESSKGGQDLPPREKEEARLAWHIKTFLGQGGNVLIPASAISRGADTVFSLARRGIKVHVDGAIRQTLKDIKDGILSWCPLDVVPDVDPNLIVPVEDDERSSIMYGKKTNKGKVVVSTSADLNYRPSRDYAESWLTDHGNALFLAGYQHDGTNSDMLLQKQRGEAVSLSDEDTNSEFTLNGIVRQFEISAHSSMEETVRYLAAMNPVKILLTHGEMKNATAMKNEIKKRIKKDADLTAVGSVYEL
jgi:metallo-beta-lactamase family protein